MTRIIIELVHPNDPKRRFGWISNASPRRTSDNHHAAQNLLETVEQSLIIALMPIILTSISHNYLIKYQKYINKYHLMIVDPIHVLREYLDIQYIT